MQCADTFDLNWSAVFAVLAIFESFFIWLSVMKQRYTTALGATQNINMLNTNYCIEVNGTVCALVNICKRCWILFNHKLNVLQMLTFLACHDNLARPNGYVAGSSAAPI